MNKRYIIIGIILLASTFLGIAPVIAQEDFLANTEAMVLNDEELDQVSGKGYFWISLSQGTEITNSYSSEISGGAFENAQGIMVPTQVTGDYNSINLAFYISVYLIPNADALSTFPHLDALISFP